MTFKSRIENSTLDWNEESSLKFEKWNVYLLKPFSEVTSTDYKNIKEN